MVFVTDLDILNVKLEIVENFGKILFVDLAEVRLLALFFLGLEFLPDQIFDTLPNFLNSVINLKFFDEFPLVLILLLKQDEDIFDVDVSGFFVEVLPRDLNVDVFDLTVDQDDRPKCKTYSSRKFRASGFIWIFLAWMLPAQMDSLSYFSLMIKKLFRYFYKND